MLSYLSNQTTGEPPILGSFAQSAQNVRSIMSACYSVRHNCRRGSFHTVSTSNTLSGLRFVQSLRSRLVRWYLLLRRLRSPDRHYIWRALVSNAVVIQNLFSCGNHFLPRKHPGLAGSTLAFNYDKLVT